MILNVVVTWWCIQLNINPLISNVKAKVNIFLFKYTYVYICLDVCRYMDKRYGHVRESRGREFEDAMKDKKLRSVQSTSSLGGLSGI